MFLSSIWQWLTIFYNGWISNILLLFSLMGWIFVVVALLYLWLISCVLSKAGFSRLWAIISGIGAWKREFIGKRQIELAEQVLAKFFEIRDAVSFIRNPFSHNGEGSTRQRGDHKTPEQTQLLDRGYIVVERYAK